MDAFTGAGVYPFTIAALILVGLVAVELCAMLVGFSMSSLLSHDLGHDGLAHGGDHGPLGAWMSWLNAGGVPLLVLLMVWLASFAIAGFAVQAVAHAVALPLPALVASLVAAVLATPATRTQSRLLARIIPREETSVVSQAELIGLLGTVVLGPLDQGKPGRVRVKDRHGNIHVLRAKAAAGHVIAQGQAVLVVDGAAGLYEAIPAPADLAARPPSN